MLLCAVTPSLSSFPAAYILIHIDTLSANLLICCCFKCSALYHSINMNRHESIFAELQKHKNIQNKHLLVHF